MSITITNNEPLTQEDFTKFMDAWLNNFDDSRQAQVFFDAVVTNHPTLQQNFWRVMGSVIVKYADMFNKDGGYYDDRIKGSVKFTQVLAKLIKDRELNYLPLI